MRGARWETHYCHEIGCPGTSGFDVRWSGETDTDPSEPSRDTCPHCGHEMHADELYWQDVAESTFQTAKDSHFEVPTQPDLVALAKAIQAELERQAKRAKARELAMTLNTCGRCHGRGEIVTATRSVGGGCVNDDWDVCPACNGTGRPVLGRTA